MKTRQVYLEAARRIAEGEGAPYSCHAISRVVNEGVEDEYNSYSAERTAYEELFSEYFPTGAKPYLYPSDIERAANEAGVSGTDFRVMMLLLAAEVLGEPR